MVTPTDTNVDVFSTTTGTKGPHTLSSIPRCGLWADSLFCSSVYSIGNHFSNKAIKLVIYDEINYFSLTCAEH